MQLVYEFLVQVSHIRVSLTRNLDRLTSALEIAKTSLPQEYMLPMFQAADDNDINTGHKWLKSTSI